MSDKPEAQDRFEINVGGDEGASASFNPDGSVDTRDGNHAAAVEMNPDGTVSKEVNLGDAVEAEVDADLAATEEEGTEATTEEEAKEPSEEADLPAFDPDNAEVVQQYEAKYVKEGGELNFEAFNDAFYKSYGADPDKADITPDQRAFVKKRTGISDAGIDTYLKGLKADVKAADDALYSTFGGKETYDAHLAWATGEGGYTEAQKARYNEALKSGDAAAIEEQTDLLRARYEKSGKAAPKPKAEVTQRRPSSPAASATNVAATGQAAAAGAEPFASLEDYQKAQAAAQAQFSQNEDPRALLEVEKRLKASPKLWKGR